MSKIHKWALIAYYLIHLHVDITSIQKRIEILDVNGKILEEIKL